MSSNKAIQKISIIREGNLIQKKSSIHLSAFFLSDIAYHAISATNDFGKKQPSHLNILDLYDEYIRFYGDKCTIEYNELGDNDFVLKAMIGHSQKQLSYQRKHLIKEEFNRQVEIIEKIPKKTQSAFPLDDICHQHTGMSLSELRATLFALYSFNADLSDLTAIILNEPLNHIHPALTPVNINRVIDFYSASYKDFRISEFAENYFQIKPIVRTSSNRLIVPDAYMLLKKLADGPLWVIRDHFRNYDKTQSFVKYFGDLFEKYVENMFVSQLNKNQYHRIPESKKKSRLVYLHK
ncbi:MAG: hypothetical protein HGB06_04500 [Chlorobaculum sp.]|jgi:hypothetical protein|nr:hypothetical protein [Chlorobaculum sp.]